MAATQANKGGAITRSKTMMDNLRRNDTKKVKRNEGEMKARQVIPYGFGPPFYPQADCKVCSIGFRIGPSADIDIGHRRRGIHRRFPSYIGFCNHLCGLYGHGVLLPETSLNPGGQNVADNCKAATLGDGLDLWIPRWRAERLAGSCSTKRANVSRHRCLCARGVINGLIYFSPFSAKSLG